MHKLLYITIIALLFNACQKDDYPYEQENQENNVPVTVTLNIQQQQSRGIRATNAMTPEEENLIYDIWLLQYNSLGELISAAGVDKRQHLRVGEEGVMQVSDLEVMLQASDDCTVFLVANLGDNPLENSAIWPDNLEAFKKLSIPIEYLSVPSGDAEDGHVNKIGLFGFYRGAVQNNMEMNIALSRLITRLRLNIKPGSEMTAPVELKLENVRSRINLFPDQTPYQPSGSTEQEKATDRAANFTSFTKTLPNLGTEGIVQYFYTGENINPSEEYATKLIVNNNGKVYTTLLGAESPDAGEPLSRNLTLERNSGYNFDINLKVQHYVEEPIIRDGWTAEGGWGVSYAERIINNSSDSEYAIIFKTSVGTYIKIDTKKETKFNVFRLMQYAGNSNNMVRSISLQGSHDDNTYTPIATVNVPPGWEEQSFPLTEAVEYRYLRIVFNSWLNNNEGSILISQFNLSYNRYEY